MSQTTYTIGITFSFRLVSMRWIISILMSHCQVSSTFSEVITTLIHGGWIILILRSHCQIICTIGQVIATLMCIHQIISIIQEKGGAWIWTIWLRWAKSCSLYHVHKVKCDGYTHLHTHTPTVSLTHPHIPLTLQHKINRVLLLSSATCMWSLETFGQKLFFYY